MGTQEYITSLVDIVWPPAVRFSNFEKHRLALYKIAANNCPGGGWGNNNQGLLPYSGSHRDIQLVNLFMIYSKFWEGIPKLPLSAIAIEGVWAPVIFKRVLTYWYDGKPVEFKLKLDLLAIHGFTLYGFPREDILAYAAIHQGIPAGALVSRTHGTNWIIMADRDCTAHVLGLTNPDDLRYNP